MAILSLGIAADPVNGVVLRNILGIIVRAIFGGQRVCSDRFRAFPLDGKSAFTLIQSGNGTGWNAPLPHFRTDIHSAPPKGKKEPREHSLEILRCKYGCLLYFLLRHPPARLL